jgi:hypothetical protein
VFADAGSADAHVQAVGEWIDRGLEINTTPQWRRDCAEP